jgi:phospholipid/cholesterol/gamma-HCH transport system ATP-binding protein
MHIAERNTEYRTRPFVGHDPVVELSGLKKTFEGENVLNGIDLVLNKTENIAILGKSGTGKSVLLKTIVGLHPPDEGELNVLGKKINDLDEQELNAIRRKIGYLFQGGALYDSMTVRQNLKFPLERQSEPMTKAEMNDAIEEALANVGLLDAINKTPEELSGGMKKRIALARTLILKPEIMLYDEPTTGLDPVTAKEISYLIIEMREKFDISSIIVTHDISCVKIASDRIFILNDKKLAIEGRFGELEKSQLEWVKSFFD